MLERPEPPVVREIFQLKRRLIDFRRNASGIRDVMNAIIRREGGLTGDDLSRRHIVAVLCLTSFFSVFTLKG